MSIFDRGQRIVSYTRYQEKCFTQIYRDLYRDAIFVVPNRMGTNMAAGNQQRHLPPREFCYKNLNLSLEELIQHQSNTFLIHELFR